MARSAHGRSVCDRLLNRIACLERQLVAMKATIKTLECERYAATNLRQRQPLCAASQPAGRARRMSLLQS